MFSKEPFEIQWFEVKHVSKHVRCSRKNVRANARDILNNTSAPKGPEQLLST